MKNVQVTREACQSVIGPRQHNGMSPGHHAALLTAEHNTFSLNCWDTGLEVRGFEPGTFGVDLASPGRLSPVVELVVMAMAAPV